MSRNSLIDVFRGVDLLEMQATEVCESSFFDHATYDEKKLNYADTIFPCFSFISGMTTRPNCKPLVRRSMQLVGLGVLFNGIPLLLHQEPLRFAGVLQRHGLSSILFNNITPLALRDSIAYPFVMTGLWYAISIGFANDTHDPFKNPKDTAQQKIDKKIFGSRTYHEHFDPEGLLGTLMTSVTVWTGYWYNKSNLSTPKSILLGLGLVGIGQLLARYYPKYAPISKPLWTPSFTMASTGWSILKFALLKSIFPYLPSFVSQTLKVLGAHSMEIYFSGELLMLGLKHPISTKSIWSYCTQKLNTIFSGRISQSIMVAGFEAIVISIAFLCHHHKLRIRFL